jgi:uncharacterized protein YjeT (DUF2065 family)
MEIYAKMLWTLSLWTLCEGSLVLLFPGLSIRITCKLFPKWGAFLTEMPTKDLRRLGAIELGFGLLLGAYLFFAG